MLKHPATYTNALCKEIGPDIFFPKKSYGMVDAMAAKRVCGMCEHITDCREYGVHYMVDGIWGGTTFRERRAIRRARNIMPEKLILERD
jgi:hypothetical protein